MTKILLISDTHNMNSRLKDDILPKHADEINMAIHLGDYTRDMLYLRPQYPNIEMHGVDGAYENSEGDRKILEVNGKRILLLHGHTMYVKTDLSYMVDCAKLLEVDACFFGHTHEEIIFTKNDIFFMNPGSLTAPRIGGRCCYGLVSVTADGQINGEVIKL